MNLVQMEKKIEEIVRKYQADNVGMVVEGLRYKDGNCFALVSREPVWESKQSGPARRECEPKGNMMTKKLKKGE